MDCCSSGFCSATEKHFGERVAARQVEDYRRKGPGVTTRLLRDGLLTAGPLRGTLLDIGSGVGALTFELLTMGLDRAVAVDASSAHVDAGRREGIRRGHKDAVEWKHADFVSSASEFQSATVVTLDRVVCCYPAYEELLRKALQRTTHRFALSYPRGRWYMQIAMSLENVGRRLTGNTFRTFVHSPTAMESLITEHGFRLASRQGTIAWRADVYVRDTT
jgi:magnesium-protoporphyrin O-methyltransferase